LAFFSDRNEDFGVASSVWSVGDPLWRPAGEAKVKLVSIGYADISGIRFYLEIYGRCEPLVLIHGGLTTIGEMQGWVQLLAKTRRVIAVEMQGLAFPI
jgi:pimeloyl-ACP methyl ester carboxylesterase